MHFVRFNVTQRILSVHTLEMFAIRDGGLYGHLRETGVLKLNLTFGGSHPHSTDQCWHKSIIQPNPAGNNINVDMAAFSRT